MGNEKAGKGYEKAGQGNEKAGHFRPAGHFCWRKDTPRPPKNFLLMLKTAIFLLNSI